MINMLVYGRNVAKEILGSNKKIKKIILQEGFDDNEIKALIENGNFQVTYKAKREIDHLVNGVHQGIILTIPDYEYYNFKEFINENIIVLLDHLEDPHNVGAIIRTCEAAGIKAIILPKDRQAPINATVMKTSAGTLDNVKIAVVSNLSNTIKTLKKEGYWIVGTSLNKDSIDYRNINYDGKIALVIGNEGSGMSKLVTENCDFIAKIPMYGTTNSLNASVAAGIMIYEIIRNRK